jgi:hypothetical protein
MFPYRNNRTVDNPTRRTAAGSSHRPHRPAPHEESGGQDREIIMNRIVTFTGCTAAVLALGLAVTGTAEAATVDPATSAQSLYSITMYVDNDSSVPLTYYTSSHNDNGHWQQQSPTTIKANGGSATITAYTNNPDGFEATVDYLTPDGHAVLVQAVNYLGESDSAGDSDTDDPALTLTTSVLGGTSGTYYYLIQNAS